MFASQVEASSRTRPVAAVGRVCGCTAGARTAGNLLAIELAEIDYCNLQINIKILRLHLLK